MLSVDGQGAGLNAGRPGRRLLIATIRRREARVRISVIAAVVVRSGSDSGCILKLESTEFARGLDMECEREGSGVTDAQVFGLSSWEGEAAN